MIEVYHSVLDDKELSDGAKLTCLAILRRCSNGGPVEILTSVLAKDRGKVNRVIAGHVAEVIRCEHINVEVYTGKPNRYTRVENTHAENCKGNTHTHAENCKGNARTLPENQLTDTRKIRGNGRTFNKDLMNIVSKRKFKNIRLPIA